MLSTTGKEVLRLFSQVECGGGQGRKCARRLHGDHVQGEPLLVIRRQLSLSESAILAHLAEAVEQVSRSRARTYAGLPACVKSAMGRVSVCAHRLAGPGRAAGSRRAE